jgi:hypothetical protein
MLKQEFDTLVPPRTVQRRRAFVGSGVAAAMRTVVAPSVSKAASEGLPLGEAAVPAADALQRARVRFRAPGVA